jgi:futalosine hydrolase
MKILLVAATELEVQPFLNTTISIIEPNKTVELLICGIGIPATVYQLTTKLLRTRYDLVIQAGIAGSFAKKLKKGDVIMVRRDAFAGPGIEENGEYKTLQVGLSGENEFPLGHDWLVNHNHILKMTHLDVVNAVTTDIITDNKKKNKQIKKKFEADIESMEGAAFHYVCLQQKVPFLQLRSISNVVGVRDKSKWKIREAIDNLNTELMAILNDDLIVRSS